VWYDDAETLSAKYEAAAMHGARGVAMWTANFAVHDEPMWAALRRFRTGPDLCVVENGGYGEQPPPTGRLTRVNATSGAKTVVAGGLQDPVWVASAGGVAAYVGLFHVYRHRASTLAFPCAVDRRAMDCPW
jgi:hypothetical protein